MEMSNPKGGRTAALAFPTMLLMVMMIMMLLNAYCCGASVLAKSNTSFRCSDGRLDECLIEEDVELELGFLIMNPYVSRILTDNDPKIQSINPNDAACGTETDKPAYRNCIEKIKNPGNTHGCAPERIYLSGCIPKNS